MICFKAFFYHGTECIQKKIFSGERCQVYPDFKEEFCRKLEFNTGAVNILNNLEVMGYKVVSSGSFVASEQFNKKVTLSTFCLL